MDKIFDWADLHEGGVAIILFVLSLFIGVIGSFLKRLIFQDGNIIKQSQKSGNNASSIQVGNIILNSDKKKRGTDY